MSEAATIPDLWPADFGVDDKQPSPSAILRQQGYILGERTHDVVFGEVESSTNSAGRFTHEFYIAAPYMKVRQKVIEANHQLSPYPAKIILVDPKGSNLKIEEVLTADHFVRTLRLMLAAPHIVQLIGSLIAQARDLDDE